MITKSLLIAIMTTALIAGCAGKTKTGKNMSAQNSDDKICRVEKTTGTHMKTKICRTKAQAELEKELAQQTMRDLDSANPKTR